MRGIQYAAAPRSRRKRRGVLDRPPEPVIRPAGGRDGLREMTGRRVGLALLPPSHALRAAQDVFVSRQQEAIDLSWRHWPADQIALHIGAAVGDDAGHLL